MRRLFFLFALLVVTFFAGAGLWYWSYLTTASQGQGEVVVTIPKGTGVRGIGALLAENGVLRNDSRFLAMVYFSGLTSRLQAGEYGIALGLTPPQVVRLLEKGSTLRHRVTVAEGLTVEQIAALFAKEGWVERDRFLALTRDKAFIASLGLDVSSLEGYLFPETYTLLRNESNASQILRMMVSRFQTVWSTIQPAEPTALTRHQLVTLASIVEKETGAASERPMIARVFFNRLALGMRLQSDPTVIYGLPDFNGNLTREDLKLPTPYNTYVISSLPPGPICNPGQAALEAVLQPSASEALYFVAKNDGTHQFSQNLTEHNKAVKIYQKSRQPEK